MKADEMNLVLLITITFTLALVHGNNTPCALNLDNNAFYRFVGRHIVNNNFNRNSKSDWQMYIRNSGLCGRFYQSFFEPGYLGSIMQICQGYGHQLINPRVGNLCISPNTMPFYYVVIDNNCVVQSLASYRNHVVVACDKLVNQCLPVHFERYTGQMPDVSPCM
ncbi:hypothetical protein FQN60_006323 [Etheostoma spectabile]|uniref:Uncharacterized protein n=1 Tax=Etheostoma spectabile TaxID=54343 RepID=A0A5J5CL52_9PERO|nr:hypothetical protein FQN60_006323 [Etheostoma spectabile]